VNLPAQPEPATPKILALNELSGSPLSLMRCWYRTIACARAESPSSARRSNGSSRRSGTTDLSSCCCKIIMSLRTVMDTFRLVRSVALVPRSTQLTDATLILPFGTSFSNKKTSPTRCRFCLHNVIQDSSALCKPQRCTKNIPGRLQTIWYWTTFPRYPQLPATRTSLVAAAGERKCTPP